MRRRKGSRANPRPPTLPGFSLTRLHSNAGWKWMFLVITTHDTDSGLESTKNNTHFSSGLSRNETADTVNINFDNDLRRAGQKIRTGCWESEAILERDVG
ncbi:hypothetical protein CAJAP_08044 [Camponotus japonicus]